MKSEQEFLDEVRAFLSDCQLADVNYEYLTECANRAGFFMLCAIFMRRMDVARDLMDLRHCLERRVVGAGALS